MNIRFWAHASVFKWGAESEDPVRDPAILKSVDGARYEEYSLLEFMLDDPELEDLWASTDFSGGYLEFRYDASTIRLAVLTEYETDRDLSAEEIDLLRNYTVGQWLDGVGSNFAQEYPDKTGLSPQVDALGLVENEILTLIDDNEPPANKGGSRGAEPERCSKAAQLAASNGDIDTLSALIDSGENVNCRGEWDQSLLTKAILGGHADTALFLIDKGAKPDTPDHEGGLPIHKAAMMGQLDVFGILADRSSIDSRDGSGMTPLMWASNRNHLSVARNAVERGANVNEQCDNGYTALTYTSSPEVASFLLNSGSSPDLVDFRGFNAVQSAQEQIERARRVGNVDSASRYEEIIKIIDGRHRTDTN